MDRDRAVVVGEGVSGGVREGNEASTIALGRRLHVDPAIGQDVDVPGAEVRSTEDRDVGGVRHRCHGVGVSNIDESTALAGRRGCNDAITGGWCGEGRRSTDALERAGAASCEVEYELLRTGARTRDIDTFTAEYVSVSSRVCQVDRTATEGLGELEVIGVLIDHEVHATVSETTDRTVTRCHERLHTRCIRRCSDTEDLT